MELASWNVILAASFQEVWFQIATIAPRIIVAVIILIIGWLVGAVLGGIIAQIVRALRFDSALESLGADELARRAGVRLDAGAFVGGLVKWFFIVTFLLASMNILGLTDVSTFLKDVVLSYLPHVFVASFMLLIGAMVAEAAQRVISGSARAMGSNSANTLGAISKWAIWFFTALVALSQLGIAQGFPEAIFMGVVATLSIAFGLAFGLGGKEAAADFIEKMRGEMAHKK